MTCTACLVLIGMHLLSLYLSLPLHLQAFLFSDAHISLSDIYDTHSVNQGWVLKTWWEFSCLQQICSPVPKVPCHPTAIAAHKADLTDNVQHAN